MAVTAGALSKVLIGRTTAQLLSAAATAGTAPYTYQWYRSQTSGFSPGPSNIITGATSLSLTDSGLTPGATYYYKVIATDAVPATSTSAELLVTMAAALPDMNQFAQSQVIGALELKQDWETLSAQVDASEAGQLTAGQAVKIVDSAGPGVPKVVACSADTDQVFGFINRTFKDAKFVAGSLVEISQAGNVMVLQATGAISAGAQVCLDVTYVGGVQAATGSSAKRIVGYAIDKAVGAQLIRVKLGVPSFKLDS